MSCGKLSTSICVNYVSCMIHRSLLENSLRKKKLYKEVIRVELIRTDIEGAGFDDRLKWDPIFSGEGDLQIDDMAKSFADSSK